MTSSAFIHEPGDPSARRLRQREGRLAFAREAPTSHGRISTPVRLPTRPGPARGRPNAGEPVRARRAPAGHVGSRRGNHRREDHDHRLSAKVTARAGSFLCKSSSIAPRIRRSRAESRMPFLHPHVLEGLAHGHVGPTALDGRAGETPEAQSAPARARARRAQGCHCAGRRAGRASPVVGDGVRGDARALTSNPDIPALSCRCRAATVAPRSPDVTHVGGASAAPCAGRWPP